MAIVSKVASRKGLAKVAGKIIDRFLVNKQESSPCFLEQTGQHGNAATAQGYCLTSDEPACGAFRSDVPVQRWCEVERNASRKLAFPLYIGESLESSQLHFGYDYIASFIFCLMDLSGGGESSELSITFVQQGREAHVLLKLPLQSLQGMDEIFSLTLSLEQFCSQIGHIEMRLHTAQQSLSSQSSIGVCEFVVCRIDHRSLFQARTHLNWRKANELQHFTGGVYDHDIYASRRSPEAQVTGTGKFIQITKTGSAPVAGNTFPREHIAHLLKEMPWAAVLPNDDPYHYAHRLLARLLDMPAPDFSERLKRLAGNGPVRILSICSGTAAVELGIIRQAKVQVDATFLDINESLLAKAIAGLPANCAGECIVGDVNTLLPLNRRYNVVICVSGLHHLVELERVLLGIRDSLEPEGEFWVIGEQIGRNGNRLWPEAYEACNKVLERLPVKYRRNAHTMQVDAVLPDSDYSSASFEGIRSEEIEACLDRFFLPAQVYKRNCFLWRLVNQAYSDNYDVTNDMDREAIHSLVVAEIEHWLGGGRPTELHGVFHPRRLSV